MSSFTTPTRRTGLAALAACAGCALAAAPAQAAYAPRVSVSVAPATAGAPVAITVEVDQDAADEATRTVRLTLPGFGPATGARARAACPGGATCPDDSRVGSAASTTSFGSFTGGVFFAGAEGDATTLAGVLSNPAVPLLLDQHFSGRVAPVAGGRELTLDGLPGATATKLRVALEGGDRAVVTAPARCATYSLAAELTSHGGQTVQRTAPVTIAGCAGDPPRLSGVRMAPARVRTGSAGALALRLSEPAALRITARRSGTRAVRTLLRTHRAAGRVVLRGLARHLTPGLWLVTVRAGNAAGTAVRTVALRVLPRPG